MLIPEKNVLKSVLSYICMLKAIFHPLIIKLVQISQVEVLVVYFKNQLKFTKQVKASFAPGRTKGNHGSGEGNLKAEIIITVLSTILLLK